MTTKDQERKALEQIRKIVAGLGENSYIGMAFEGCFEIAESNIENDFGDSMKARCDSREKEALKACKEASELKGTVRSRDAEISEKNREIDSLQKLNKEWKEMYDSADRQIATMRRSYEEKEQELADEIQRGQDLQLEIIYLKAKLYDLLVQDQK